MIILLLFLFPIITFTQSHDLLPSNIYNISYQTNFLLKNNSSNHPIINDSKLQKLLSFFQKKRYNIFLKESAQFIKKNPLNSFSNELSWLRGHALLQEDNDNEAQQQLLLLTNLSNIEIKHRALLDLTQIALNKTNYPSALTYLDSIYNSPLGSPYKEIAHTKQIHIYFLENSIIKAQKTLKSFENLYPNSSYLPDLRYLFALAEFLAGNMTTARTYANKFLSESNNLLMIRLLAELDIQEQQYPEALKQFIALTQTNNQFYNEALFKAALLQKHLKEYTNAFDSLTKISKYYKKSPFYDRALKELADINILLKNYDDALVYYLRESGYQDTRQAFALLKIAEINFLKTNTTTLRRVADRIQKKFPYSAYANESLYWVGRSYILDKEFKKSIAIFDSYLIREPQSPKKEEILIFLGYAYSNIDNQAKARTYFQTIINESSNDSLKRKALIGLGKSYYSNEPKRSLEYFDRVWKIWPTASESAQALYYSGATRYNLQINTQALKNFCQLNKDFPNSSFYEDSLLAIAKLEFKLENFQNIININNIPLTEKNKEQVSEFKELQARSFFRIGDYKKALPLFQESLKLTKNKDRQVDLFLAEGSTLRGLGQHREAVKNYERYLKATKKSEEINELTEILWTEIIYSYLEIPNISRAEKTALFVAKKFSNSVQLVDIFFKLADEFFSEKKYKDAAQYYQKIRSFPFIDTLTAADALLREAWSLDYSKDPSTQKSFELFLTNYPDHFGVPDIMNRLAELQEKTDPIKSKQLRTQIIAQYPTSPEAEEARLYFLDQINSSYSIDDFYQVLSKTTDLGLKAKYLYKLGIKMEEEGKIDEAIQIFKDIHSLRDSVHGADSLLRAGNALVEQKKYEEALKLYINIIAQYDEKYYPVSLNQIIQIYLYLEQYDNAERFKKRLIDQFPESQESKQWLKA